MLLFLQHLMLFGKLSEDDQRVVHWHAQSLFEIQCLERKMQAEMGRADKKHDTSP